MLQQVGFIYKITFRFSFYFPPPSAIHYTSPLFTQNLLYIWEKGGRFLRIIE